MMTGIDITTLNYARVAAALVFMVIASALDLKYRRVKDILWIAMGAVGIALLEAQILLGNLPSLYHLLLVPVVIIFADAFIERKPLYDGETGRVNAPWLGIFALAGIILAFLLIRSWQDNAFLALFTVPVIMILAYILYYTDILRGGADAKALMAVGILMPVYPEIGSYPLWNMHSLGDMTTIVFPFALTMLMNAAIISIFLPLSLAVYNLSKGSIHHKAMFLGYRVPLDEADRKKEWLMQKVRGGELVIRYMPEREEHYGESDDDDDESEDDDSDNKDDTHDNDDADEDKLEEEQFKKDIEALRGYGLDKVWVSPKLPFIVFMTAGLVISLVVGNLLLGLVAGIATLGR